MPLKSRKQFIQTSLRDALSRNFQVSNIEFAHFKDLVKQKHHQHHVLTDSHSVLIGKIVKLHEFKKMKDEKESYLMVEIVEINEQLEVVNQESRLRVKLRNKLALQFQDLMNKNYLAFFNFTIDHDFPEKGYYQCILDTQKPTQFVCFSSVGNISTKSIIHNWKIPSSVRIKDLKANTKCCFYGIVNFCGQVKTITSGSHKYSKMLTVNDESRKKIQCILFYNETTEVPVINELDIIRLEEAQVKLYNGMKQVIVNGGRHILAFDHDICDSYEPRSSSKSPVITDEDLSRIAELRHFVNVTLSKVSSLSELHMDKFLFCLECQVLGIIRNDNDRSLILQVWDGTEPASFINRIIPPAMVPRKFIDESFLLRNCDHLFAEILIEGCIEEFDKIKPKNFIHFRNIHLIKKKQHTNLGSSVSVDNMSILCTASERNFEFIEPSESLIKQMCSKTNLAENDILENCNIRNSIETRNIHYDYNDKIISVRKNHRKFKQYLINEIKTFKAPKKFKLICNLVACHPSEPSLESLSKYFCAGCKNSFSNEFLENLGPGNIEGSYHCPSLKCTDSSTGRSHILSRKLAIKFLVQDKTGELEVMLWDQHAESFFNGLSMKEVCENKKMSVIYEFMKKIQSNETIMLDCYLFSYNTTNGIRYQIFDTFLRK